MKTCRDEMPNEHRCQKPCLPLIGVYLLFLHLCSSVAKTWNRHEIVFVVRVQSSNRGQFMKVERGGPDALPISPLIQTSIPKEGL
jgi:hypothetical protein